MYDVNALEDKWKRYKTKQRLPFIVGIAATAVFVGIYLLYREEIAAIAVPKVKAKDIDQNRSGAVSVITKHTDANSTILAKQSVLPIKELNSSAMTIDANNTIDENATEQVSDQIPTMEMEMTDQETAETEEKVHVRKYLKIEMTDMPTKKSKSPIKK